ncbi:MAG TPA: 2OG-Fe(II) oxygenase [Elusimicrobiota bacterium]|nr:2OG-Fe(II) oxygenase [Elusimicrobiota bacterium]
MNPERIEGISPAVAASAQALARRFRSASPFPYLIIDDFLSPDLCRGLLKEFPPYDRKRFSNIYGHPSKAVYERPRELGKSFAAFDAMVSSRTFMNWLGRVSGIKNLLYDPLYTGAGAQENLAGMHLFPHVDFNRHLTKPWRRRVNLMLYLNEGWKAAWGGCLQLFRADRGKTPAAKTIAPVFNRCAIFAASEKSWHGVTPVTPPAREREALSRKSVSVYFYTRETPESSAAHLTLWRFPGLPDGLEAGRRLRQTDIEAVNRALFYRDSEIDDLSMRGFHMEWKSPLPPHWRPGYRLSPEEAAWLKRQIRRQDARLGELWYGRSPVGLKEAVEKRRYDPPPLRG